MLLGFICKGEVGEKMREVLRERGMEGGVGGLCRVRNSSANWRAAADGWSKLADVAVLLDRERGVELRPCLIIISISIRIFAILVIFNYFTYNFIFSL